MKNEREENKENDLWNENNKWKDDFEDKYNSELLIDPYENQFKTENNFDVENDLNNIDDNNDNNENDKEEYISTDEIKAKRIPLTQPPNLQDYPEYVKISMQATSICIGTAIQGFMIGSLFGTIQGAAIGLQLRNNPGAPNIGKFMFSQGLNSGISFGIWLSVFETIRFTTASIRHKNDVINPILGGFCAGVTIASSTRSRSRIIFSGLSSAAMMGLVHYFTGGTPKLG